MGEHDCVWDASHQSIFDSSGETPPSSPLNSNSNININNKMNNNVNINDNFKDNNQPNLPSNPGHELSSLRHIYHPRGKVILLVHSINPTNKLYYFYHSYFYFYSCFYSCD